MQCCMKADIKCSNNVMIIFSKSLLLMFNGDRKEVHIVGQRCRYIVLESGVHSISDTNDYDDAQAVLLNSRDVLTALALCQSFSLVTFILLHFSLFDRNFSHMIC